MLGAIVLSHVGAPRAAPLVHAHDNDAVEDGDMMSSVPCRFPGSGTYAATMAFDHDAADKANDVTGGMCTTEVTEGAHSRWKTRMAHCEGIEDFNPGDGSAKFVQAAGEKCIVRFSFDGYDGVNCAVMRSGSGEDFLEEVTWCQFFLDNDHTPCPRSCDGADMIQSMSYIGHKELQEESPKDAPTQCMHWAIGSVYATTIEFEGAGTCTAEITTDAHGWRQGAGDCAGMDDFPASSGTSELLASNGGDCVLRMVTTDGAEKGTKASAPVTCAVMKDIEYVEGKVEAVTMCLFFGDDEDMSCPHSCAGREATQVLVLQ